MTELLMAKRKLIDYWIIDCIMKWTMTVINAVAPAEIIEMQNT